jgi:hypothetical protein
MSVSSSAFDEYCAGKFPPKHQAAAPISVPGIEPVRDKVTNDAGRAAIFIVALNAGEWSGRRESNPLCNLGSSTFPKLNKHLAAKHPLIGLKSRQ